jgi:hypothetical protein
MKDKIKRCSMCKKELALKYFHRNRATYDGLQSYCKKCIQKRNISNRKEYYTDPTKEAMKIEMAQKIKNEYWSGEWHKRFEIYV